MSKSILIFFSIFLLSSCKIFISKKYKFNQKFEFETRADYINFLQNKKGFTPSVIIYPDSAFYDKFLIDLAQNQLSVYYGCLVNDTMEIAKSALLKDNLNCAGRILGEIKKNIAFEGIGKDSSIVKSSFRDLKFRYLTNNSFFDLGLSTKKLKIFLIYGHALGTYFDSYFRQVNKFYNVNENETDLFIITIDPVRRLN